MAFLGFIFQSFHLIPYLTVKENVMLPLAIMKIKNREKSDMAGDAIEAFDRAILVNPRQEAAYFNKGVVFLHDLNDRENAIKAWEELLRVNPMAKVRSGGLVMELVQDIKAKKP